jgi:hypothetical protein
MQRLGNVPDQGFRTDLAAFCTVGSGNGRANGVTVNDRGDNPAIENMQRALCMLRLWLAGTDRFITRPIALDLQAVLVDISTAPAIVSWDVILECLYLLALLTADALLAIARVLYCAPILPGSTRICKGDRPHNTGGFIFADHLPHPWVQRITQTIANQVDREGGQEDE